MADMGTELDRLERALERLEAALLDYEKRSIDLLDARQAEWRAEASNVADRVDRAIHRLETVLER